MTAEDGDEILEIIEPDIPKQDTSMRQAVPTKVKLAATLLQFLQRGQGKIFINLPFDKSKGIEHVRVVKNRIRQI